jgi:RimJ/RimL family protein N-acetyltransferase
MNRGIGMTKFELRFVEENYKEDLKNFSLPEEQEKFTSMPEEALTKCEEDPERYPVVITASEAAVGFFVLHKGESSAFFSSNRNAMVIRALSINHSDQGKGYAKKAMLQLPKFIARHFPEINELILAVNFKNTPAKQLYEKAGFMDRGQIKHGPAGPQHVLTF